MYSGVVILPAVIVYWIAVVPPVLRAIVIGSLLLLLADLASLCLTLSCALGWVVAKISLKLKNKSFITVIDFAGLLRLCTISSASRAQTIISDLRRQRRCSTAKKSRVRRIRSICSAASALGNWHGHGRS